MLDPKLLRDSPATVRAAIARKHLDVDLDAVLALDNEWRRQLAEVEALRGKQKAANNEMAALKKGSPEFIAKVTEMKGVSAQVKAAEEAMKPLDERLHAAMLSLPNIPHASVPDGKTPEQNVVHATHGSVEAVSSQAMPHWEIAGFNSLIDFGRGAKVTGAGFPFYVGDGARIVRALLQFFLDEDVKAGYTEVAPPIFVNAASATATGQLPDKEGQMYETADKLYAVPTAEVPLTNFFRDEIVEQDALPIKRCAYTPCFRREAGSYGKDVRGLNRLHQFDKVELLKWVHPSSSYDELEALRADAERLLQKLELPYRVLLMCGGDLGFSQSKKYDLEVWAAGQKRWLEVSSCSNFESFQARRAQIRFRNKETGKPELVHTLNGSGLAVPRVLAALLENNLQADGRVKLPAALVPYFGKEYLSFK
ncbi:serine--tRNA ligase [Oleiharenicola lentus]|uniref:Serine--tRNA ligase n=1 Tax=Oleiharenicola lentus TaxID=2508720 RepID=A0A4Q1CAC1_9BACT|nr:serine--tRNA ligase [Oleiharenicola lentus]RXK56037.1 serine--tRNA ligase [Oleiharenicola lentus]